MNDTYYGHKAAPLECFYGDGSIQYSKRDGVKNVCPDCHQVPNNWRRWKTAINAEEYRCEMCGKQVKTEPFKLP